ncbi:MAG: hypothetical protein AABY22_10525 [Nanoarchaeota archaeon]
MSEQNTINLKFHADRPFRLSDLRLRVNATITGQENVPKDQQIKFAPTALNSIFESVTINGHDITKKLPETENKEFDKRKEEADKNIFKFIEQAYGPRTEEVIDTMYSPCEGCGNIKPIFIDCWECYINDKYESEEVPDLVTPKNVDKLYEELSETTL